MYHIEEFKNKTTVKNYLEHYVDVTAFLEYCKACRCYGRIWSCPPYDFEPEAYWEMYRYVHILGTKLTFDREAIEKEKGKEAAAYIRQVYLNAKEQLSEKMYGLEQRYPGSVTLSAGNCTICSECARPAGQACLHPDRMRYSIEALGGNVVKTAEELLGVRLQWTDGDLPETLTLVNGLLTDDPAAEI